jgi:dihydrofolate reductase
VGSQLLLNHQSRQWSRLCQSFLELDLVDEMRLSIAPVLLGDGLSLFGNSGTEKRWHLMDVVAYKTGFVELLYRSESTDP